MAQQQQPQNVPVRVYQSDNRIMVAAPLPGLEPENICVTIAGDRVTIGGECRGVHQDEVDLLAAEWRVGPYYREVVLPEPVDGALSNATYGNGVLVVMMPKAEHGRPSTRAEFELQELVPTRGEHVGHVGHDIQPTTTEQHRRQVEETAEAAGAERDVHALPE
jgi:HSP20 family protein